MFLSLINVCCPKESTTTRRAYSEDLGLATRPNSEVWSFKTEGASLSFCRQAAALEPFLPTIQRVNLRETPGSVCSVGGVRLDKALPTLISFSGSYAPKAAEMLAVTVEYKWLVPIKRPRDCCGRLFKWRRSRKVAQRLFSLCRGHLYADLAKQWLKPLAQCGSVCVFIVESMKSSQSKQVHGIVEVRLVELLIQGPTGSRQAGR